MPRSSPRSEKSQLFASRNSTAVLLIFLLVVIALAARLLAWPYQGIVSVDGTNYIRVARDIFGGPHHESQQPPGYPFLIGLVTFLSGGGDGVRAARLVDLFCGVALLVPFFLLARRLFGTRTAFVVGLALALTPIAIRYSVTTMSESPYLLFILLAVLAFEYGNCGTAGGLAGLAFLVRPEAMVAAAALGLTRCRKPRAWLALAGGFVLAGVLPSLLYNHHATGQWLLTRKGVNMAHEELWLNEPTVGSMQHSEAEPSMIERVRRNAGSVRAAFPKRLAAEARNLAGAVGWPLAAAVVPAVLAGPAIVTAGLAQAVFVPLIPGVPPVPRIIIPLLPFVLLLGAGLVHRLAAGTRRQEPGGAGSEGDGPAGKAPSAWSVRGAWAVAIVFAAGWLVASLGTFGSLRLQEDGFYPEEVDAGRALMGHLPPDALVFDRKPYIAFYAGARYQATPVGGYHDTINSVVAGGGDYLVVDESITEYFRPSLLPLIRDSFTMLHDPRLDLIYFDGRYRDRHLAIYRIIRPGGPPPMPARATARVREMVAQLPNDSTQNLLHSELLELAQRTAHAEGDYKRAGQTTPH